MKKTLTALSLSLLVSASAAQTSSPLGIAPQSVAVSTSDSFNRARAAAQAALASYPQHFPDQPLWREAITLGRQALEREPNNLEILYFLASSYSITNWHAPAWASWTAFLEAGGTLDANAAQGFANAGRELGFSRYEAGDFDVALTYYRRVSELVPNDVDATVWTARILTEAGRPQEAAQYWEAVTRLDPADQRARYFLGITQDQVRWGVDAATAFREGVSLYESGNLAAARDAFAQAATFNAQYTEAWAWLGRSEFERRNYRDAATYYGYAVTLEPGNETYNHFLNEAQRRQ